MITDWRLARTALSVLAMQPTGLGGAVIRMRASPDRDILTQALTRGFGDLVRITPDIDDLHLFGGIDIAATLNSGQLVETSGILNRPRVLCLVMAERCNAALAARLARYLDAHPSAVLIALDESAEDTEGLPNALMDRLAFALSPEGHAPARWGLRRASVKRWVQADCDEQGLETLTAAAAGFGIASLRAPFMAIQCATVLAGAAGRQTPNAGDLSQAASLVYAHRATHVPSNAAEDATPPPPPPEQDQDDIDGALQELNLSSEMVVEAVKAVLPPEVLAGLGRLGATNRPVGQGSGQKKRGNRRGRPIPARPGRLDGRNRLDILSTLRAAAPWQPMRRKAQPKRAGLLLRPSDFRIKRYETKSDRCVIFAVDASGSAAISRLNEAKGAIELLLGEAYAARDHVALVSFRGETAECLLSPTRSLVQTKRKLSALPGGGGTPLASGLNEAMQLAMLVRTRGMSPVIVLVTDGKTNIAMDGTADRARAREDAMRVANSIRLQGLGVLVIDIAARPQPALRDISQHLDGDYLPLPRADSRRLSGAVQMALDSA